MPRRNKHKREPVIYAHGASYFDENFNEGCYGCSFAGRDFVCLTGDGKCLKSAPDKSGEAENAGRQ